MKFRKDGLPRIRTKTKDNTIWRKKKQQKITLDTEGVKNLRQMEERKRDIIAFRHKEHQKSITNTMRSQ